VTLDGATFAGRVAVVTGGGSGLGRTVALKLAEHGAAVAVDYVRSEQAAHEVVGAIEVAGGRAVAVQADVSDPEAMVAMAQAVEHLLGPVELLVASAAVTEYVPFSEVERLTASMWARILGVNLVGAFLSVQALAPQLRARGSGSVVLVSSNSAISATGSSIPYTVSKAGVVALAQCLARALAPAVRVNAVAPGWMPTPWIGKYLPPEIAENVANEQLMTPVDDVADAILGLLANESVTGSVLVVDRGELVLR
jgi:NAD(P)-dependent dehydrogenase (short-subunit alcohol dehydrogenase family)